MLLQLVQDLRTLRALAEYLLRFDAVTFLMYLENLRATEGVTSVWLFHDAAHTIFEQVCFLPQQISMTMYHTFTVIASRAAVSRIRLKVSLQIALVPMHVL